MKKKLWLLGGICVALVFGVALSLAFGYYPIASVNGRMITAREFSSTFRAGMNYSQEFFSMASSSVSSTQASPMELQAVVLDQIVENVLVSQEVDKELGGDAKQLTNEKVARYDSSQKLHEAAARIFQMPYQDFAQLLLVPQAKRELLMGRLFLRNEKYEDWVARSRTEASVTLYSSEFKWQNGKIVAM